VVCAQTIEVQAHDVGGVRQTYACEGFETRAIQHEPGHLDDILFLDRLVSRRNDLLRRKAYE
jgi:peptide deformylase